MGKARIGVWLAAVVAGVGLWGCETAGPSSGSADTTSGADAGHTDGGGTDSGGPAKPVIFINEIAAMGGVVLPGPPSDWIELHNGGASAVDVGGWRVGDKIKDFDGAFLLPANTKIEAGGHLVVYFNHDQTGAPLVVDKKLGSDEEAVLFDPKGALVDQIDWQEGDSPDGGSFGRSPDGTAVWKTFTVPSPGKANK